MFGRATVDDRYCQGHHYTIEDVEDLAQSVALLLVQEYELARAIACNEDAIGRVEDVVLESAEVEDIISRRLNPKDVFHRDGLLFQLMMWVASYGENAAGDLVSLPHSQGSAKGQDSIIVHRGKKEITSLSICEDKATKNPRKVVREEVWPEIEVYERGGRRDEIRSNIIMTLGTAGIPIQEALELIRGISWKGKQRYRVRVTIQKPRTPGLFKGFQDVAKGGKDRRRGESVLVPKLREWMSDFAKKVEENLRGFSEG